MLVMYSSAIFYDIKVLDPPARMLVRMNPLYLIIENFRNAVYGDPINQYALIVSAAVSFLSLIIGVLLFYKKQDKFILNI
jgi:ABC-2 type transport system permease protein